MTALIGFTLEHLWGFLLGCMFSLLFIIIWYGINCISEARQENKEKGMDEFSMGKDLFDVNVPDFLPHEEVKPNENK